MGKKARNKSKSDRRQPSDRRLYSKALKYVARGSDSKLAKLLAAHPEAATVTAYAGNTPLHDACRAGNTIAVKALVSAGAKLQAQDASGNTPLHIAAMHGHVELINAALQLGTGVDVDTANKDGHTVFELVEAALERQQQADAAEDAAAAADARKAAGDERGVGSSASRSDAAERGDDFMERLRYEMMAEDPEAAELAYGGTWGGPAGGGGAAGLEDDDAWADRLWREMQARRRRQQQQASKAFLDDLRKEAQQRQQHARSESDRILQEERAKDAAWRQATIKQAPSVAQLRQAYDAQWQALQERMGAPAAAAAGSVGPAAGALQLAAAGSGSITYAAVPWLVPDLSDRDQFEAVVLHGVEGPADVKRRLRAELLRWHPDKFVARFGARLAAGDRDRVLAGVQHTSQMLTSMVAK